MDFDSTKPADKYGRITVTPNSFSDLFYLSKLGVGGRNMAKLFKFRPVSKK